MSVNETMLAKVHHRVDEGANYLESIVDCVERRVTI